MHKLHGHWLLVYCGGKYLCNRSTRPRLTSYRPAGPPRKRGHLSRLIVKITNTNTKHKYKCKILLLLILQSIHITNSNFCVQLEIMLKGKPLQASLSPSCDKRTIVVTITTTLVLCLIDSTDLKSAGRQVE